MVVSTWKVTRAESLTRGFADRRACLKDLYLPLRQHIGEHNKPLVEVGNQVLKGHAMIAASTSLIRAASTRADVRHGNSAIGDYPVAHPIGSIRIPASSST